MGRSFSTIFVISGLGEPLFGFAKLPLEVANAPMQGAQIALSREIQHTGDALHPLVEGPLEAAPETKPLHHQLLDSGVLHQLREPRVSE